MVYADQIGPKERKVNTRAKRRLSQAKARPKKQGEEWKWFHTVLLCCYDGKKPPWFTRNTDAWL